MTTYRTETKPNGPAAAAFVAAGIGSFVLGLNTTIAQTFRPGAGETAFWDFAATYGMGSGVGPLSGKVTLAAIAYVLTLIAFGFAWRGREINLTPVLWIAGILLLLGFAGTFPPIFEAFHE
jgi:hypothetical protein